MVEKVIYNELPEASLHLRLWEMTDAQQALTGLAATLRTYGVHVRFERDELDRYGLRFVERLNAFTALMDEHTIYFNRRHADSPAAVSESP